jgi:adenosylcobinamide-phosphate guanylyltransferase
MKVVALIMAGGRGKRLELPVEKPLLQFLGKPLIEWIVEAVKASRSISDFYVVTSQHTPETERRCNQENWSIIRTDGKNYHDDLKQAVLDKKLCFPVLTIPADLPALTGKFIDKTVAAFVQQGKDALAVFATLERRDKLGLSVSSFDQHEGVTYAVSGINILNGSKIFQEHIETGALITDEIEAFLNINTKKDLEIAQRIVQDMQKMK